MSRDGAGNYSIPLPQVLANATIESAWANETINDISIALTDSLSKSGKGSMTSVFKAKPGTAVAPGITFSTDVASGLYNNGGELGLAYSGVAAFRLNAAIITLDRDILCQNLFSTAQFIADATTTTQKSGLTMRNAAADKSALYYDGALAKTVLVQTTDGTTPAASLDLYATGGLTLTTTLSQLLGLSSSGDIDLTTTGMGNITVSTDEVILDATTSLRILNNTDLSTSSTGHGLQVGPSTATNVAIDNNEIMARNNGAESPLYLNYEGGGVRLGGAGTTGGHNIVGDSLDVATTGSIILDPGAKLYYGQVSADNEVLTKAILDSDASPIGHLIIGDIVINWGFVLAVQQSAYGVVVNMSHPVSEAFVVLAGYYNVYSPFFNDGAYSFGQAEGLTQVRVINFESYTRDLQWMAIGKL
jgi:hypothetical protein